MAKFMIVKKSDLQDRWDPEFYFAVQPLQARIAELKALHPDKVKAMNILAKLPMELSKEYAVLSRREWRVRTGAQWSADARLAVEREYPWAALAMAENGFEDAKLAIALKIAQHQDEMEVIDDLAAILDRSSETTEEHPPSPQAHTGLIAGFRYRLWEADRYDDDFGTGYAYADIPSDVGGGPYGVADAWITNEAGSVHPGYASNPTVIAAADVDLDNPEPSMTGTRERVSAFPGFGGG